MRQASLIENESPPLSGLTATGGQSNPLLTDPEIQLAKTELKMKSRLKKNRLLRRLRRIRERAERTPDCLNSLSLPRLVNQ
jgi:hypothetical protein